MALAEALKEAALPAAGAEAVPLILEAMARPEHGWLLVEALEELSGQSFGLDLEAWTRWSK